MSEFLGWLDIAKGVGELIIDEGRAVFHALTDQLRNETPSSHFKEPSVPNPIHLNRWEDEEYTLFPPDEV